MNIKCTFVLLFYFCVWEIVQPTPVPFKRLSKEELNQIALRCIDEINIDKTVIEDVLRTQILPHDDQKYKKYLACSYKKQGYLSLDGTTMLYSNLYEFLSDFYSISDLQKLDHCKSIKDDDAGELCFKNLDCILNGLRKIEADNGIQSENDFESNHI